MTTILRWTAKSLLKEPANLFASAGGIALSLLLVILVEGLFAGESERIVAFLRRGTVPPPRTTDSPRA